MQVVTAKSPFRVHGILPFPGPSDRKNNRKNYLNVKFKEKKKKLENFELQVSNKYSMISSDANNSLLADLLFA